MPLVLEMHALKASYWKGDPYIVECHIRNVGFQPIVVDTGFQGVHRFGFLLGRHKYMYNQTYPGGGLDFGERRFLLKPNEQLIRYLALNGWMNLDSGDHKLTGVFDTKNGVIKSTFAIHVGPEAPDIGITLDKWFDIFEERGVDSSKRYEFIRCIASVCVKNPRLEKAAILLQKSPDPERSKFFHDVVSDAQQSWNAID